MTMTLAVPRRKLISLQFAIADWRTKMQTGLSIEVIELIRDSVWRYMHQDLPDRPIIRCRRHDRNVEFWPTEVRHRGEKILVTFVEHCPGDEDLRDPHSGLPHDFIVTRGFWTGLSEIPIASAA